MLKPNLYFSNGSPIVSYKTLLERQHNFILHPTESEDKASKILDRLYTPYKRQVIIHPYIVDFVVSDKFILEIDGDVHNDRDEYDTRRDRVLYLSGFDVYRICNDELNISNMRRIIKMGLSTKKPDNVLRRYRL